MHFSKPRSLSLSALVLVITSLFYPGLVYVGRTVVPALAFVVETLWDMRYKSPMCREMFTRARDAGVQPRHDDHLAIFNALQARDPKAARKAMHRHLDRVIDSILAATETEAVERVRSAAASKRKEVARRSAI